MKRLRNKRASTLLNKLKRSCKIVVPRSNNITGKQKYVTVKLQRNLANGDIDALISMKCLDQGVDVPEARMGVFLSSTKFSTVCSAQRENSKEINR